MIVPARGLKTQSEIVNTAHGREGRKMMVHVARAHADARIRVCAKASWAFSDLDIAEFDLETGVVVDAKVHFQPPSSEFDVVAVLPPLPGATDTEVTVLGTMFVNAGIGNIPGKTLGDFYRRMAARVTQPNTAHLHSGGFVPQNAA